MNKTETSQLLLMVSAYDNRHVEDMHVEAWHAALEASIPTATFADCRLAVVRHYTETPKWIMPSHVIGFVGNLRRTRRICVQVQDPEPGLRNPETGDPVSQEAWEKIYAERLRVRDDVLNGLYQPDPPVEQVLRSMAEVEWNDGEEPFNKRKIAPWSSPFKEVEQ